MSFEPSRLATCPHGLKYDATQSIGCVVCRREAGLPSLSPAPSANGRRAALLTYGAIGLLAVLVVGGIAAKELVSMFLDRVRTERVAVAPDPGGAPLPERGEQRATPARAESAEDAPPPAATDEAGQHREALRRARESVSITVYTTTWCPTCVRAKQYMNAQGISYTERDIESSDEANEACRRLNPQGSIPTFDIEGQVLVGFAPQALEQRIDRAAQQRL